MKRMYVCAAAAVLAVFTGCRHVESSPIVKTFEQGGGGNVDQSTADSIGQFLAKHPDLRKELTPPCKDKRASASADWNGTDEGKVCAGVVRRLLREAQREIGWCGVLRRVCF